MLQDAGAWLAKRRLPTRSSFDDYYKQYKAVNGSGSVATRLVLAPLNGVKVDTLLNKLPQWAELAKEGHALLHSLEHVVDLLVGCEAANTEADTGVRALVAATEGT